MKLTDHLESRDAFIAKMGEAQSLIVGVTETLKDVFNPTAGPYLLFNQSAATLNRCGQLKVIVERLYNTRVSLLKSDLVVDLLRRTGDDGAIPETAQELHSEGNALNSQIELDFETMLIFVDITLNGWAFMAGNILGDKKPAKTSFATIAKDHGEGPYAVLWKAHKDTILWLDSIRRLYRNKMIVHRERPWQMGSTRSLMFLDWTFWTPIASGWMAEQETAEKLAELNSIASSIGIQSHDRVQSAVLQLLRSGSMLTSEQRQVALSAAYAYGFQTPSFQEFAHQIADFLISATATLLSCIKDNSSIVNLGGRH
jgi:hypothetical protein